MKRLELMIGGLVVVIVLAAMVAMWTIPRPGPRESGASSRPGPDRSASSVGATSKAGPGAVAPDTMADPARRLWASDPDRSVYVFGEAVRPGAHPMPADGDWTVKQLVETVKGFKPEAAGRFRVLRKVDGAIGEVLNLSKEEALASEEKLEPGDVVYFD